MNILIFKNNEQLGPYSEEQLESEIATGTFSLSDFAWAEGKPDWIPLSELLPNLSGPAPLDPRKKQDGFGDKISGLFQNLSVSAQLGHKQAERAKLSLVDLPSAFQAVGQAAFTQRLALNVYGDTYSEIETLENAITAKKQDSGIPPTATVGDKAKHMAFRAADLTNAERLSLKRKKLLTSLGETLCEPLTTTEDLATERAQARLLQDKIKALDLEISDLSSLVPKILRKPVYLLMVPLAIVAAIYGFSWFNSAQIVWEQEQEWTRQQNQSRAELTRLDAETARLDARAKQEKLEQERADRIQKERDELAAKEEQLANARQAEADRAEERKNAEATRLAQEQYLLRQKEEKAFEEDQRLAREREAQVQAQKKQEKDTEEARLATIRQTEEQRERAAFCDRALSSIPFTPNIHISVPLRRFSTSAEVRGRGIERLIELQKQRDWLGMLGAMGNSSYDQYPPTSEIESLRHSLLQNESKLLIKTKYKEIDGETTLILIAFLQNKYQIIEFVPIYEKHPDGIGYLTRWNSDAIRFIAIAGSPRKLNEGQSTFAESAAQGEKALKLKVKLGEMDETTYQARRAQLQDDLYKAMCKWADSL